MNYGRFAKSYSVIEKLTFWNSLEKSRFKLINNFSSANSILIIGEGDGRFLKELRSINQEATIDIIEISQRMIEQAKTNQSKLNNINFIHGNILDYNITLNQYDLVITTFFLDNFSSNNVTSIIDKIHASLKLNGFWYNCDFNLSTKPFFKLISKQLLYILYTVFRPLVKIEANYLVNIKDSVKNKFTIYKQEHMLYEMLVSTIYRKIK